MSRLGVVIFGATGFTGKYAVLEMVRLARKHPAITWGVAGRSLSKLEALMQDVAKKTGEDLSHIKKIIADVAEEDSLKAMCLQAKVIANCCGPYHLYGEPVVKAAIEAKTHHVDITGEAQFIETMQLKYGDAAREAGVYVISACGFDSIPSDMGTVFLQQNFRGTLNSVESYMSFSLPMQYQREAVSRGSVHYGTWASLVHGLSHSGELASLRKKLYPEKLPTFKPKLEKRSVIHKREEGWCLPFPGADSSIVYRTQRALHAALPEQRPAQFRPYIDVGGWLFAAATLLAAAGFFLLTRMNFMCRLMLKYPRIFTFGIVTHEGPSEAVMENTSYKVLLYGEGWEEGMNVNNKPNRRVVAQVSGSNPGYGATVSALLYSAITIIEESDKMPDNGGVVTTGYAFRNTNLIKHLSENNMKFQIIETSSF